MKGSARMYGEFPERGGGRGGRCCESGGMPARGSRGWGSLLEPALLAALADEGTHGYDLRKVVEEMTGGSVCADPGGTYRVLRRLEEQGFVSSRWSEGEHGPQRREYELTEGGRALLAHWREHLREREQVVRSVLDSIERAIGGEENATASRRPDRRKEPS